MKLVSYFKREKGVKKSKIKGLMLATVLVSSAVVLVICSAMYFSKVPEVACAGDFSYSLEAEDREDRDEFFRRLGYTGEEVSYRQVVTQAQGEGFLEYNELQLSQGLDLRGFEGVDATEYTYRLSGKEGGEVYGVILVYRGRVVALHFSDFSQTKEIWGLV